MNINVCMYANFERWYLKKYWTDFRFERYIKKPLKVSLIWRIVHFCGSIFGRFIVTLVYLLWLVIVLHNYSTDIRSERVDRNPFKACLIWRVLRFCGEYICFNLFTSEILYSLTAFFVFSTISALPFVAFSGSFRCGDV